MNTIRSKITSPYGDYNNKHQQTPRCSTCCQTPSRFFRKGSGNETMYICIHHTLMCGAAWQHPFCKRHTAEMLLQCDCDRFWIPVADLGWVREVQMHPLWRLIMYFFIHNCTSPSNDYAAVACSNSNQVHLHAHVSVPYWSPDVWLGLDLLRNIQFGLPAILKCSLASYQSHECVNVPEVGVAVQNLSGAFRAPVAELPFYISRSATEFPVCFAT